MPPCKKALQVDASNRRIEGGPVICAPLQEIVTTWDQRGDTERDLDDPKPTLKMMSVRVTQACGALMQGCQ